MSEIVSCANQIAPNEKDLNPGSDDSVFVITAAYRTAYGSISLNGELVWDTNVAGTIIRRIETRHEKIRRVAGNQPRICGVSGSRSLCGISNSGKCCMYTRG